MPHLTFGISPDGFALTVLVGLNGKNTTKLVNAGRMVPAPVAVRAVIDSGSDVTCIATRVAQQLGLVAIGKVNTHTFHGSLRSNLYEVSLSIPRSGNLTRPLLVLEQLLVMELLQPPPDIELLLGKDVLLQCLLLIDGPRGEFTVAE